MGTRVISRLTARLVVFALALAFIAVALSASVPNAKASSVFSWTTETPMGATVAQAVVVGAANGTVYVMGGVPTIAYTAMADSYAYDPDTGDWTVLASMLYAVRGAAGAMGHDGKVYVFGGAGGSSYTQIYDPQTNSWSLGASMLDGAWEAKAATVTNGSIWVVGGEGVAAGYAQVYNPVDDTWYAGTPAPVAVECGAMVAVGDDLYYSGGGVGGYTGTTNFYMYDASAGSWVTTLQTLPTARAAHAMVVGDDGLIYVVGGSSDAYNAGADAYSTVGVYDPATDEWSAAASMDNARKYLGATVTPDGRIMALGGNTPSAVLNAVESLQLYEFQYTINLSASSVRAGETLLMTVDAQFTHIDEYNSYLYWYLESATDGTTYNSGSITIPTDAAGAITLGIPALVPPGNYKVVVDWTVYAENVYEEVEEELTFQVLAAPQPTDALIADLQARLMAQDANITDILMALGQLGTTFANFQTQLDDMQDQVNRIEDKADAASMYAVINLVLVIIVIVLLAMMFMMARKKP
jgi:N-acetylneuraminic acid mutarotase